MFTPMNAIMGMTQIAKMQPITNGVNRYLNEIDNASRKLMNLISNVLDVSGMEYGSFKLANKRFDFNAMCRDLLHTAGYNAAEKGQFLKFDIDPAINGPLMGDETRLKQVISNLLANAVKFTPDGGTITLAAKTVNEDDDEITVKITVSDTGAGIAEESRDKLFNIFEVGGGVMTRKHGGIGLGLPISKRIIEMMGGEITVETSKGEGSVFQFTCRLKKIKGGIREAGYSAPILTQSIKPAWNMPGADLRGKVILVADDSMTGRAVIRKLLSGAGADIIEAENGKTAVELFITGTDKVDLILMDINMPVMDGCEAARRIRAAGTPNAGKIPIIALTGHINNDYVKAIIQAGMDFHLEKTGDPQELLNVIKRCL
jgi:CheY-like chemotaxis protein